MQVITYFTAAIWSLLVRISTPFLLLKRLSNSLEEKERYQERFGKSLLHRPVGKLIWLHGASVGESLSLLPIIERIRATSPNAHFLITTTTVSSAKIIGSRLPSNCVHQYIPYDAKAFVKRFLNYWKPQAAILVESELWPNIILGLKKRGVPTFLLNARLSDKSFRNWKRFAFVARSFLNSFQNIYTQSDVFTQLYKRLGVTNVETLGNIKTISAPLPCDESELNFWQSYINNRPCWIAASTHENEEEKIIKIHKKLKEKIPNLVTIIAPRHVERCDRLLEQFYDLPISRFSNPVDTDEIILVDRYAKLGIFYRLCLVTFIGNSLIEKGGGHNPLEPAVLGSLPVWGKNFQNFNDMQPFFAGISCQQQDEIMLTNTVAEYLLNPESCKRYLKIINQKINLQHKNIHKTIEQIADALFSEPAKNKSVTKSLKTKRSAVTKA